jgi:hypothetical protein
VHPWALDYKAAVERHYSLVKREPRNSEIAAAHVPQLSGRGWDHRKKKLRDRSLGGRDWIEVWPPPRDWHPSWEALIEQPAPAEPDGNDGLMHMVVDEIYDPKNGELIKRRIIKQLGHLGATAAIFYSVLDMLDGRADESVSVLRMLRLAFESILPWVCSSLA